jgi:hypothetical protein
MGFGRMNSTNKNPATEAFDKAQRRAAPLVIVLAAVVAIWLGGAPIAFLPIFLVVGVLYLSIVFAGTRLIRTVWDRRQNVKRNDSHVPHAPDKPRFSNDGHNVANKSIRKLAFALVVVFCFVQAVRLLLGEGWSWIYTVGYSIVFLALCMTIWIGRSTNRYRR